MALSRFLGGFKSNIADSTTGLSQRDRAHIADTWSLFRQDLRTNAVDLFKALFSKHPAYQKLFVAFADVVPDQLQRDHCATAHALAVVYFFTAMVDSINDKGTLEELIRKNARNHVKRSVSPDYFVDMGSIIIEQLQAKMSFRMTPGVVSSWERFFVFHDMVTRRVFKELSAPTHNS